MHKYPTYVVIQRRRSDSIYCDIFYFLSNPLKGATFYVMHSRTETFCLYKIFNDIGNFHLAFLYLYLLILSHLLTYMKDHI